MRILRAHGVDFALCALAAAIVLTALGGRAENSGYAAVLGAAGLLVLLARSWWPPAASLMGFALEALSTRVTPQLPVLIFLAILVSFTVAGLYARHAAAVGAWVGGCVLILASMIGDPGVQGPSDVILTMTFCTVLWAAALAAAEWRRQAVRAHAHAELVTATRDRDLAEATAHERARIAGELHDVVSHGLSIVILQTVAARMALHDDADPVPETDRRLGIVEATARDALDDMRRLLDLLRATELGTTGNEMAPSAGLDQVPGLVEQGRLAGLVVELTDDRQGPALSPGLDAAAYRIAQEAITNVIKHAPGASARVLVHSDSRRLQVQVDSDGGVSNKVPQPGAGYGLIGMRQRAELYGGSLDARPCDGGFTVRACFPLGPK